ncbi:MAG: Uma2 family endonuclease [Verrucomicrobiaceae bacterium]|nr:MAG: Uma2 family endonuclease [Verrucomicrobiaceae bacterium]
MSASARAHVWISPEEYLEGEKLADVKHEYVGGDVFAMAGASADHNRIAGNIFAELRAQLRGKPCEAFVSDMKVKIPPFVAEAYFYPDVVVGCSPRERDPYVREEPAVIFEVLSATTERTDRSEKATAYLRIPSLQAYVIVAQDHPSVIVRFRAGVNWKIVEYTKMDDRVELPGIQCELTLEQIYERVSWRNAEDGV